MRANSKDTKITMVQQSDAKKYIEALHRFYKLNKLPATKS
jgi:hypothetical protein